MIAYYYRAMHFSAKRGIAIVCCCLLYTSDAAEKRIV